MKGLDDAALREALIESGYVMPHWPKPWGRDAGAVEQLVIEQEFRAAGVTKPQYSITGWVILTLIQHATEDQVARWVLPALRQEVIWCQLFSEPDAGSDAAGVKTRGTRVDGGWLVNGQKVWTSGAHYASFGLATIRTDPDAPKHKGITTMVIDMHADGVEVRPLKMTTGQSEFNEVFFNDVFVPDDDVIGPVNGGLDGGAGDARQRERVDRRRSGRWWRGRRHAGRVADRRARRAPRTPIGWGGTHRPLRVDDRRVGGPQHAERPPGRGRRRPGARGQRGQARAVGARPRGRRRSSCALGGPESAYAEGAGMLTSWAVLMHRGMSIAGGTSEIKRNQIGERILGLPRDPLIN